MDQVVSATNKKKRRRPLAVPPLRAFREGKLLTRSELAKKCSVSYQTVMAIETGKSVATFPVRRKILEGLGLEPTPQNSSHIFG